MEEVAEMTMEEQQKWMNKIPGDTPYEKTKTLQGRYNNILKITDRSKLWWGKDLAAQLKITRDSRKEKLTDNLAQEARVRRWKEEQAKVRALIKEKKTKCWQKFCKDNGTKDPWEITKWAKDPWRLKGTVGKLTDTDGNVLVTDGEKVQGLVRDHFGWDDDRRRVGRKRMTRKRRR